MLRKGWPHDPANRQKEGATSGGLFPEVGGDALLRDARLSLADFQREAR